MVSVESEVAEKDAPRSLALEEREPLLRTKLFVPPMRPDCIARPRLFEKIQGCLDKPLILITAPAGYGKTTLAGSWLRETGFSATWLSLDEDDNDPIRFLQYFIASLQQVVPAIKADLLGLLQGRQPGHYLALMNILINEISERATPFVFVLDDFHTLQAPLVLEMCAHLFEHMPPPMHLMLLSRIDPPVPLSRLRARNQLLDIRVDQLHFTQDEIARFLNDAMALKLSAGDVLALEERTEGWIAGLQLAAISMQSVNDVHGFVSAFTGSHYYIMDYLVEEVLRLQTETVRAFLLQSSILDRMCGALCEGVVVADPAEAWNGQAMLEALEQMNLFIVPLDNERRWYRYHHLFADVLNRRLEQLYPHLLPELHKRASRWYEQNGLISHAIQHARLAGDMDRAARLVDENGCLLLMRGEVTNLLKWVDIVDVYSRTYPWIAIQKVWSLCLTGQLDRVEGPLDAADQLISSFELTDEVRTMAGAVTTARALRANMLGNFRLAADFARQALAGLPPGSDFSCSLRSAAVSILGDASWMGGNLAEAQRAYADAVRIGQAAGSIYMVIIANTNLADILLEQGQLHQAARIYSEALQMAVLPDGQISPLAEKAYAGLGRIFYEWNHLDDAAEYIRLCIELSQRWGNAESLAIGYGLLAKLEQVQGHPDEARKAMRAVEQLDSEHSFSLWWSIQLKAVLARLWIAQGDPDRASFFLQQRGIPGDGEISHLQEALYLVLLRLYLARGEYDAAAALSAQLLKKSNGAEQSVRMIETLTLQALAFQGQKEIDRALEILSRAFMLCQSEGYTRVFLDEGEPMLKLLYQAKARRVGAGYAAELLSAIGDIAGSALPPAELLIEPLTSRELEVLKLIEAGCSNQGIAAQLVISLPTVKRHISNIYAKLGASSRTQAVARAKELDIFP